MMKIDTMNSMSMKLQRKQRNIEYTVVSIDMD